MPPSIARVSQEDEASVRGEKRRQDESTAPAEDEVTLASSTFDTTMSVAAWGATGAGQLGIGDEEGAGKTWLTLIPSLEQSLQSLATGYFHSLAITKSGTVYTTGKNDKRQLGRDGSEHRWQRVTPLETVTAVAGAAGSDFSLVVDAAGRVYAWGAGDRGQLGLGREAMESGSRVPRPLKALSSVCIQSITCGTRHCIALSRDGRVFSWGEGADGQLGDGQFVARHTPEVVADLRGKGVVSVAAGSAHSLALTGADQLYAFGNNNKGQLGLGDSSPRFRPTLVKFLNGKQVCQVVAGDFHTAARTRTGHMYSWGSNQCGQLGLGSKSDAVVTPTEVTSILEIGRVLDVSAGRRHTVGLICTIAEDGTESVVAFACGANNMGQLGLDPDHPASKRQELLHPVRLRRASAMNPIKLVAGGNHTIMIFDPTPAPMDTSADEAKREGDEQPQQMDGSMGGSQTRPTKPSPMLRRKRHFPPVKHDTPTPLRACAPTICYLDPYVIKQRSKDSSAAAIVSHIETFFSSAACLNAAYIHYERVAARHTRSPRPIVNMDLVRDTYTALVSGPEQCLSAALRGLRSMVLTLKDNNLTTPADFAFIPVVLEFPLLLQASQTSTVLEGLVRFLSSIPDDIKPMIMDMYNDVDSKYFFRAVKVLQSFLTHLETTPTSAEPRLFTAMTLGWMNAGNERLNIIRYDAFYNEAIGSTKEKMAQLIGWMRNPSNVFSYCMFPFLLTPAVKADLLRDNNTNVMANQLAMHVLLSGQVAILKLSVRRSHVYEDTMRQLAEKPPTAWTLPLRVEFKDEEGVDEGGLVKEYFQLILPKIISRAFVPLERDGVRWFWFSTPTDERLRAYHTMGLLFGLALHNSVLVDPLFPKVLYKMLLTDPAKPDALTLEDLESAAPDVARGLRQLLEYEGRDERDVFCLAFEITVTDDDGNLTSVPLKEDGADTPVTFFNKQEYVQLYTNYYLYGRCAASFDAFKQGFLTVCQGTRALRMLRPEELELMLCGNPEWDLRDVEKAAKYVNLSAEDDVVKWFWEVVHELPREMKRRFLAFLTGSSRVPVRGASAIQIVIQKAGEDESRLPAAHTCYNVLDLPVYKSKETLREKLATAIKETEGFSLV